MRTQLIGIVNLTPDSFSDGRPEHTVASAVTLAQRLIDEGATVIDIGAESTRPNATPITASEEWQRLSHFLVPLIEAAHERKVAVSLDTRHPENAAKAITYGVDWINDVSGFNNHDMIEAVKGHDEVKCVFMHSLDVPVNPANHLPETIDVVNHLIQWAFIQIKRLEQAGIDPQRLIFDPGLGFGKTPKQCWNIIDSIDKFTALNIALLIGHSRKSFLVSNVDFPPQPAARDELTHDITKTLARNKVDYLRVHDVAGNADAIREANQ